MNKRKISLTFMLPEEFPNPNFNNIYFVLRGGLNNIYICSSQDFRYNDQRQRSMDKESVNIGKSLVYRCTNMEVIPDILENLAHCNDAIIDSSMVLEQGEKIFNQLKNQLAGGGINKTHDILRITSTGEIYLPRENIFEKTLYKKPKST